MYNKGQGIHFHTTWKHQLQRIPTIQVCTDNEIESLCYDDKFPVFMMHSFVLQGPFCCKIMVSFSC